MNQEFYSSFEKIKLRFIGLLKEQTDQISKASVSIRQTPPNHSDLIVIRDIAHRIAGTAGTLGFHTLGQQAGKTEDLIRRRDALGSKIDDDVMKAVAHLLEVCESCQADYAVQDVRRN
ncbi:Hpt domain-containing protein [Thalassococcus profundi]|uniref:Hpt domain-containing protein n=1 Tax=Thalassococcus profundi TaxID=2282382 RepID=A0A369TP64_9RHOB|nr:Hpt domain-containing protein [Thalassococcus profundi]RDD65907.1 Hpt domain-containing protein [Thalassococcus profundi]